MKKILVFGMSSVLGGVESFVMNYFRNMDQKNFQFDFLVYDTEPAYSEEIIGLGGEIHIVPGARRHPIGCKKAIDKVMREKRYDIAWGNYCFMSNLVFFDCAKRAGISRRIIHAHNSKNMSNKLHGILHLLNRHRIRNYATDFWACSEYAGEYFYPSIIRTADNYCVIPNAIDATKYQYNLSMRERKRKELRIEDRLVMGNIGRLHPQKNQKFLIDIFSELKKIKPEALLIIVGEGNLYKSLRKKVIAFGLEKEVLFLGSRKDINELLQVMDIFVFPSLYEGLPITLFEAQASGVYIFASSDVIPSNAKLTEQFTFVSLEETAKQWAERINSVLPYIRQDGVDAISAAGYEIETAARRLEKRMEYAP